MTSTLAERVKERMNALGLNNAELARACKVKPPTSYNWANGKTKSIKGEQLLRAAHVLQVLPQWLATGRPPMFPSDLQAQEAAAPYKLEPKEDPLRTELLAVFSQLDEKGKKDALGYLRVFVAGYRPHSDGEASAVAGK
ncbi:hypothetical protein AZ34_11975 [Hylemonella gracilis str. Niagara R]|uniref:HTH cro/C1-type domain-containing protein n=1 Tax=Hylemonella gracilis str. Niagara R TaxID=1458275 RepID=A0A016XIP2_9BURK|nr:helix-turn-helix domain-containing protein [Hylemonella gracilis]EYC51716.1 hypothetical protein AZ34_11975 [Hylemonella gracilis str. Niagara R]